jgi:hypothetical protein
MLTTEEAKCLLPDTAGLTGSGMLSQITDIIVKAYSLTRVMIPAATHPRVIADLGVTGAAAFYDRHRRCGLDHSAQLHRTMQF